MSCIHRPRAQVFLEAYLKHQALTSNERALLRAYLCETWLSCRIRAMRKVEPQRRLEILTFGMARLLDRWDEFDVS